MTANGPEGALVVREIDGETVILDTEKSLVHQLNRTASLVWRMERQGLGPETMAVTFAQEFEVDELRALQDVRAALQRLESLSLLSARGITAAQNREGGMR